MCLNVVHSCLTGWDLGEYTVVPNITDRHSDPRSIGDRFRTYLPSKKDTSTFS